MKSHFVTYALAFGVMSVPALTTHALYPSTSSFPTDAGSSFATPEPAAVAPQRVTAQSSPADDLYPSAAGFPTDAGSYMASSTPASTQAPQPLVAQASTGLYPSTTIYPTEGGSYIIVGTPDPASQRVASKAAPAETFAAVVYPREGGSSMVVGASVAQPSPAKSSLTVAVESTTVIYPREGGSSMVVGIPSSAQISQNEDSQVGQNRVVYYPYPITGNSSFGPHMFPISAGS